MYKLGLNVNANSDK